MGMYVDGWRTGGRTLLRAMTRLLVVSSAITTHSTVCAWMPRVTSTTSSTRSMMCAPPMMVRIREAWPGQSTSVTCTSFTPCAAGSAWKRSGRGMAKEEKPCDTCMYMLVGVSTCVGGRGGYSAVACMHALGPA